MNVQQPLSRRTLVRGLSGGLAAAAVAPALIAPSAAALARVPR